MRLGWPASRSEYMNMFRHGELSGLLGKLTLSVSRDLFGKLSSMESPDISKSLGAYRHVGSAYSQSAVKKLLQVR